MFLLSASGGGSSDAGVLVCDLCDPSLFTEPSFYKAVVFRHLVRYGTVIHRWLCREVLLSACGVVC